MTPEAVKALDARSFAGQKAVVVGLANGVASWAQVISRAEEMARQQKEKKRMAKAINALLGLPDDASAEDIEKAATAKRPILELGAKALELTGAPSAEAAKGHLVVWQQSAAEVATLRAKAAEENAARETAERNGLYVEVAKKMGPAAVWQNQLVGLVRRLFDGLTRAPWRNRGLAGRIQRLHRLPDLVHFVFEQIAN